MTSPIFYQVLNCSITLPAGLFEKMTWILILSYIRREIFILLMLLCTSVVKLSRVHFGFTYMDHNGFLLD